MSSEQLVLWAILDESRGAERCEQEDPQAFTLQADDFRLVPPAMNPRGAEALERRLARLREIEAARETRKHATA